MQIFKSACPILSFLLLWSCSGEPQPSLKSISDSRILLGSLVEIHARHDRLSVGRIAIRRALDEIARVEAVFSSYKPESEITRINRLAGRKPVRVSAEVFTLLQRALAWGEQSGGVFDVTIGALSSGWGFTGTGRVQVPDSIAIRRLNNLVNYRNLQLNTRDSTVFLGKRGMELDLGGIAKGYAIDRAGAELKAAGVTRFLINAGGDILTSGLKENDQAWRVGIQHPRAGANQLLGTLDISDIAVASSGDYERFTVIDDTRYHHLLDPRNGYPARDCQSATVLAANAETADLLATCFFVLGQDAVQLPALQDVPYLIVQADGRILTSPEIEDRYQLRMFQPKDSEMPVH